MRAGLALLRTGSRVPTLAFVLPGLAGAAVLLRWGELRAPSVVQYNRLRRCDRADNGPVTQGHSQRHTSGSVPAVGVRSLWSVVRLRPVSSLRGAAAGPPAGGPFLRHGGPGGALGRAAGFFAERRGSSLWSGIQALQPPAHRAATNAALARPPGSRLCADIATPQKNLVAGARGGPLVFLGPVVVLVRCTTGIRPHGPRPELYLDPSAVVVAGFSPPPPRPGGPAGASRGARGCLAAFRKSQPFARSPGPIPIGRGRW